MLQLNSRAAFPERHVTSSCFSADVVSEILGFAVTKVLLWNLIRGSAAWG